MQIGYKRVSSQDQDATRQLADIHLDRCYTDKISGATKDRPALKSCLDALREGDTLHVHAVDRLARSLIDAVTIIEQVLKSGATIYIYSPRLTFSGDKQDAYATFQLQLFSAIAELERSMIKTRQSEGIAQAKINGTKSGKPWGTQPLDMSLSPFAASLLSSGMTITAIAKQLNLSRASIYKLLKGHSKITSY